MFQKEIAEQIRHCKYISDSKKDQLIKLLPQLSEANIFTLAQIFTKLDLSTEKNEQQFKQKSKEINKKYIDTLNSLI